MLRSSVRNETPVSLRWINSVACGNNRNHRLCFTFGLTTRCLQKASDESYKNSSHPGSFAFFEESTVIFVNISETHLFFLEK